MKKYLGYAPAVFFTVLYGFAGFDSVEPIGVLFLACFWISGLILHKGYFAGAVFGALPAIGFIFRGIKMEDGIIDVAVGGVLLAFFVAVGYLLWKKRDEVKTENKEVAVTAIKFALSVGVMFLSTVLAVMMAMALLGIGIKVYLVFFAIFALPSLLLPLIWLKKRKKSLLYGLQLLLSWWLLWA